MKKPVTILTGFLGSGKTTFLNHLLEKKKDSRYLIIENEFGEQAIDNELLLYPKESILELKNGCICCSMNDNLYEILNDLCQRGSEFDEIIIEATGIADPIGLIEPFIVHPLFKEHFPITTIICLIDAELVEDHLEETVEAVNQITFSDILVINKIDLVGDHYVKFLENKLQELNPLARIVKGHRNAFPEIEYNKDHNKLEELLPLLKKESGDLNLSEQNSNPQYLSKHTKDINNYTFKFDAPFDYKILSQQLFMYLSFQSRGLYRMKGLVWLMDNDHQHILQSAGKRFDFHKKRPWAPSEPKQSVIVFIGKNLQREKLAMLLKNCLADKNPTTEKIKEASARQ